MFKDVDAVDRTVGGVKKIEWCYLSSEDEWERDEDHSLPLVEALWSLSCTMMGSHCERETCKKAVTRWTRMMGWGEIDREWLLSQPLNGWEWLTDGNWPLSQPIQWVRIDGILIKGPLVDGLDRNWSLVFTAPGDIWLLAKVVFGFYVDMEDLENPVPERNVGYIHGYCDAGGKFRGVGLVWWPWFVLMEKCSLLLGGKSYIGVVFACS